MTERLSQFVNVTPGNDLVINVGGETFVHHVVQASRVQVTIIEREIHSVGKPEIGAPTLTINPRSGDDIRTR
jgi:hypothetical protein